MAALIDTNVLVYRVDERDPRKQEIAADLLRRGLAEETIRIPHQAVIEFVAAVTRSNRGVALLPLPDALREAEEYLRVFKVLYPNEMIVRNAIRGCAAYQLNWFDAHLWAYAECFGLADIVSEDFEDGRMYGSVRAVNPFLDRPRRKL